MQKTAILSEDGKYRYLLERRWAEGPAMAFIMLNPSTADASVDDPTIRRCIGFAQREKAPAIVVANLFAWRATEPKDLPLDPIERRGPDNDRYVLQAMDQAWKGGVPVVFAWGANKAADSRYVESLAYCGAVIPVCLGLTRGGHPRHPLYVQSTAPLVSFWGKS